MLFCNDLHVAVPLWRAFRSLGRFFLRPLCRTLLPLIVRVAEGVPGATRSLLSCIALVGLGAWIDAQELYFRNTRNTLPPRRLTSNSPMVRFPPCLRGGAAEAAKSSTALVETHDHSPP